MIWPIPFAARRVSASRLSLIALVLRGAGAAADLRTQTQIGRAVSLLVRSSFVVARWRGDPPPLQRTADHISFSLFLIDSIYLPLRLKLTELLIALFYALLT